VRRDADTVGESCEKLSKGEKVKWERKKKKKKGVVKNEPAPSTCDRNTRRNSQDSPSGLPKGEHLHANER
jgi:hypothetical protein